MDTRPLTTRLLDGASFLFLGIGIGLTIPWLHSAFGPTYVRYPFAPWAIGLLLLGSAVGIIRAIARIRASTSLDPTKP